MRSVTLVMIVLLAGCKARVHEVPATEVLLRVDASAEVRAAATQLRIGLAVQRSGTWSERPELRLPTRRSRSLSWPIDIPIVPHDVHDPPELFQVVADAIDSGDRVLAQRRAITSFVSRAQLVLELVLERCGDQPLGAVCEPTATCTGADCLTCVSGKCDKTPVTTSDTLPPIVGGGNPVDAGDGGSRGPDGGGVGRDAGDAGGTGGSSGRGGQAGGGMVAAAGASGGSAGGSSGSGSGQAGAGGGDAGVTGEPAGIATLDAACSNEGKLACAGHDVADVLSCSSGRWTPSESCAEDARCDPQPGAMQGSCQPIPAACVGKNPGDATCEGTARRTCDADLLRLERFDCPSHTHCEQDAAGVRCACDSGYEDDGSGACTNIDDCAGDACGEGAVACMDGVNGRSCTCGTGYAGTGTTACADIDECAAGATAACGNGASGCTNGAGSYTCACGTGYSGSGTTACSDIDECGSGAVSACGTGATGCTNLAGSYRCTCGSGYAGNGTTACSDVDECAPGATAACGTGANGCTNTTGSYRCSCGTGYTGNGTTACTPRSADDPATPGDDRPNYVECTVGLCSPGEYCCILLAGPSDMCVSSSSQTICSDVIRCDGPEDCGPGQVCCEDANPDFTCRDVDQCLGRYDVVCHTDADCPSGTCTGSAGTGGSANIKVCIG